MILPISQWQTANWLAAHLDAPSAWALLSLAPRTRSWCTMWCSSASLAASLFSRALTVLAFCSFSLFSASMFSYSSFFSFSSFFIFRFFSVTVFSSFILFSNFCSWFLSWVSSWWMVFLSWFFCSFNLLSNYYSLSLSFFSKLATVSLFRLSYSAFSF